VHLCPTGSEVKSCVDIGDGSSVEIVDAFCYLGGHFVCGWWCWCCCDCQDLQWFVYLDHWPLLL